MVNWTVIAITIYTGIVTIIILFFLFFLLSRNKSRQNTPSLTQRTCRPMSVLKNDFSDSPFYAYILPALLPLADIRNYSQMNKPLC